MTTIEKHDERLEIDVSEIAKSACQYAKGMFCELHGEDPDDGGNGWDDLDESVQEYFRLVAGSVIYQVCTIVDTNGLSLFRLSKKDASQPPSYIWHKDGFSALAALCRVNLSHRYREIHRVTKMHVEDEAGE